MPEPQIGRPRCLVSGAGRSAGPTAVHSSWKRFHERTWRLLPYLIVGTSTAHRRTVDQPPYVHTHLYISKDRSVHRSKHISIRMSMQMSKHMSVHVSTHMSVHTSLHTCLYTCLYTHVCTHVTSAYAHVYAHMYTHIYTHVYTERSEGKRNGAAAPESQHQPHCSNVITIQAITI